MTEDSERTFIAGNRNPQKYGFSVRICNGVEPDLAEIERASSLLGRQPFYRDGQGYECEIIAAAIHPDEQQMVYVESRAKQLDDYVDIAIKIHYVDSGGRNQAVDIESYNPFFGCDVCLLRWWDEAVALLIYREKHWTFVYRIGDQWPPEFARIDDRWQIEGDVLAFMKYKSDTVHRLRLPALTPMNDITTGEAGASGQLPPDPRAR